jgi:hypothetical protein
VLVGREELGEELIRIRAHRAKLEHLELAAVAADAGLREDGRAAVQADQRSDEKESGLRTTRAARLPRISSNRFRNRRIPRAISKRGGAGEAHIEAKRPRRL